MIPAPDIPGHSVIGVLGSGGFATVYRTWQVAVGRETAVKVDSRVLHTERDQRRFFREVTAAGRLSGHPNVVDVYDAGALRDGRPYLVMELCPGGSLNDELHRDGPMSAVRACRIGVSLADALAAAHAAGILHRDIKPANVLVNSYGVVGLSDFGLASIIATSGDQSVTREALTPAYAPPESFHGAEPTAAADVYSLAATLYALVAGRPPRYPADGGSPSVAAILALHGRPVDDVPGVPPEMMAILRQCLAADPARRLPSAAALRDSLAALLEQPVHDSRPTLNLQPALDPRPALDAPGTVLRPVPRSTASQRLSAPSYHPTMRAGTPGPGGALASAQAGPAAETDWAAGHEGHAPSSRSRARPLALATLAGGSLVLAIIAALIVTRLLAPGDVGLTGKSAAGAIGKFGVATTVFHCPAVFVPGAGARCPASPECWGGVDETEGVITTRSLPCDGPHTWQTFAIGIMPSDVSTYNVNVVQANPVVRAVCSDRVLLSSRTGRARLVPLAKWRIQVAPPDEAAYDAGVRAYRCLADSDGYDGAQASQFGA